MVGCARLRGLLKRRNGSGKQNRAIGNKIQTLLFERAIECTESLRVTSCCDGGGTERLDAAEDMVGEEGEEYRRARRPLLPRVCRGQR